MAEIPCVDVESGGEALLPKPSSGIRRGAHLRTLRFSGAGGGGSVRETKNSVRARADRHVRPDREERGVETDLSRGVRASDDCQGERGSRDVRARSTGAGGGRNSAGKDSI